MRSRNASGEIGRIKCPVKECNKEVTASAGRASGDSLALHKYVPSYQRETVQISLTDQSQRVERCWRMRILIALSERGLCVVKLACCYRRE